MTDTASEVLDTTTAEPSSEEAAENPGRSPAWWVPTLYFMEGLPNVVTVIVSVLMYKSMGLKDGDIALFTSLITLPWMLKPLWSPLLEAFKSKKRIVFATQILGGAAFGCLALALASDHFLGLTLALFTLIAFNSATHDIAADGIYVSALDAKGQAKWVGVQGASYNIARFLAQGGFVWIAGQLEYKLGVVPAWMTVMGLIGGIMVLLSLHHLRVMPTGGERAGSARGVAEAFAEFADVVKTFFQKKNVLWAIAFIVLYRFAEGNQVKIVPLFMRAEVENGGLGLSTSDVGIAYGMVGSLAFVLGSILGGMLAARRGLKSSLLILCAMFNVPNVVYAALAFTRPEEFWIVCGAIWLETFGYGFGFVGLILFMMQQVAPGPYKMAHYAFATGIMFLGFLVPSSISGYISDAIGYKAHFIWVMIATIPSFYVSWKVPFRETEEEAAAAAT